MITLVIGHRGVGKSHFLKRLATYYSNSKKKAHFYDLDKYIEKNEKNTIIEIFSTEGESFFRELEKKYFLDLITKHNATSDDIYIVLGGGFEVLNVNTMIDNESILKQLRFLWIQRKSDSWGRIFLDRPRLDVKVGPITEFLNRAQLRKERFAEVTNDEYLIPEGLTGPSEFERKIIFNEIANLSGVLTLLPSALRTRYHWEQFITHRKNWGLDFFEIRDDLLSATQIQWVLESIPKKNILFSFRNGKTKLNDIRAKVGLIDCDLSLIDQYDFNQVDIISNHERQIQSDLSPDFAKLEYWEQKGLKVKLAIEINNFTELYQAHIWQQQSKQNRSFLPRSSSGKWKWYRLLQKNQMLLQFIREGEGSAVDQPTLYEWMAQVHSKNPSNSNIQSSQSNRTTHNTRATEDTQTTQSTQKNNCSQFAAILGSPVDHSFTPIVQSQFFSQLANPMPVFTIDCDETEFKSAMLVLEKLGLQAAAVTSPLKLQAYSICKETTPEAQQFQSVNTLYYEQKTKKWVGHNTDLMGLEELFAKIELSSVAVWGGGGTLPLLKKLLPQAIFYSAQTGQPRDQQNAKQQNLFVPEVLVWAAPNQDEVEQKNFCEQYHIPPNWKPKIVIDLNYREDSAGRLAALEFKAKYISGEKMFFKQAEGQRLFWQTQEENKYIVEYK